MNAGVSTVPRANVEAAAPRRAVPLQQLETHAGRSALTLAPKPLLRVSRTSHHRS